MRAEAPVTKPAAARSRHVIQEGDRSHTDAGTQSCTATHFQQVAKKAEAGHVRHRVDAGNSGEIWTGAVETGRRLDKGPIAGLFQPILLQCGRENAHAEGLPQHEGVVNLSVTVAPHIPWMDHAPARPTRRSARPSQCCDRPRSVFPLPRRWPHRRAGFPEWSRGPAR